MKPGEQRRSWTEDEDRELREIAAYTLNHRRRRGYRESPAGRLRAFALKHGRTEAAVKMRAKRIAARSYWK